MSSKSNIAHFPKYARFDHMTREREIFRDLSKRGELTIGDRLVATLSSRNGMEFYLSAYSVMWGLCMAFDSGARAYPHLQQMSALLNGSLTGLGVWIAAIGVFGLCSLWAGRRSWRANCALLTAPAWGIMLYAFVQIEPPILLGAGTYLAALLAELWVYARIQNSMDKLILVGGRDHVRGG